MPLPITEDPFDDDLGYGAAIHVVSTNVRYRLTWGIMMGILQGLWDILVDANRYLVSELQGTFILTETGVDNTRHCSCTTPCVQSKSGRVLMLIMCA